jgi:prepilin-type N-terminal cleavage/methylation domain-containing protein
MIHSKNKYGFSLLETIIAMALIAGMATPLVIMQGTILRRVISDARHMERLFLMRNFLQEARQETPAGATTFEKTTEKSNTQLRYQLMSPQSDSSIHTKKGMYIERVTATWRNFGKETQDTLISMKYIEPETQKATS